MKSSSSRIENAAPPLTTRIKAFTPKVGRISFLYGFQNQDEKNERAPDSLGHNSERSPFGLITTASNSTTMWRDFRKGFHPLLSERITIQSSSIEQHQRATALYASCCYRHGTAVSVLDTLLASFSPLRTSASSTKGCFQTATGFSVKPSRVCKPPRVDPPPPRPPSAG